MHFVQRPTPQSAGTLGSWLMILEVIGFICISFIPNPKPNPNPNPNLKAIFVNAGLIAYTSKSVKEDK